MSSAMSHPAVSPRQPQPQELQPRGAPWQPGSRPHERRVPPQRQLTAPWPPGSRWLPTMPWPQVPLSPPRRASHQSRARSLARPWARPASLSSPISVRPRPQRPWRQLHRRRLHLLPRRRGMQPPEPSWPELHPRPLWAPQGPHQKVAGPPARPWARPPPLVRPWSCRRPPRPPRPSLRSWPPTTPLLWAESRVPHQASRTARPCPPRTRPKHRLPSASPLGSEARGSSPAGASLTRATRTLAVEGARRWRGSSLRPST
jgi:hypothetical protein